MLNSKCIIGEAEELLKSFYHQPLKHQHKQSFLLACNATFFYFHLIFYLFFIYYYPIHDPIRDPVRDPVRDPIRDPIRDPVRDPVRSWFCQRR